MDDLDVTGMMEDLRKRLKPYDDPEMRISNMPENGMGKEDILGQLRKYAERENQPWKDGRVSGAVYHGGDDLLDFLEKVYHIYSQSNPLHPDIWPSLTKMENEIVAMSSGIMNGDE
ncbi:MAG: aspartate aminotransferase family protein, partial [Candidatus Thermoplasmatota archaeon]|nr:aspartate aminotransferase family protein [Candidatus Thermoplasmatota archaeon]